MLDDLNKSKLISRQQHGFLARDATNKQMFEACNDCAVHLSNRNKFGIAYLDFAKAFDCSIQNRITFKLNAYGFDDLLYSSIREFLSNRYQCVKVRNFLSSACNVIVGVLQGSVVGPLLFITYINDPSDVANNYQNTLLSRYLQMTPNVIPVLKTLKMWKLCNIVLTLCCSGQKSGNLHFLVLNAKYLYSEMLNLVLCISLVVHLFLMLIIILILALLWTTKLSFKLHISGIIIRAKQRAALILRCFHTRDSKTLN